MQIREARVDLLTPKCLLKYSRYISKCESQVGMSKKLIFFPSRLRVSRIKLTVVVLLHNKLKKKR